MRSNENKTHIEGRVYQHSLAVKTVQNQQSKNYGKPFINGSIEIATDEQGLNIVPVKFNYVPELTNAGATNKTYTTLMNIIQNGKTVLGDGFDNATKVVANSAIAVNDFVAADDSMVSQVLNQGGFIEISSSLNDDENSRNTFKTDMVITNISRVEADPEKFIDNDYIAIRGYVFDFRNTIIPIEYVVKNPMGMSYFESLDVTNAQPVYTKVWGRMEFKDISVPVSEESAFGEAAVTVRNRKVKHWTVTGASKVPYDFGDEKIMTAEELNKAIQDREIHLASVRQEKANRQAAQATAASFATPSAPATPVAPGGFSF